MFRLQHRRRPAWFRKRVFGQIEHDRRSVYFPLNTHLPAGKSRRLMPAKFYSTLAPAGWDAVYQRCSANCLGRVLVYRTDGLHVRDTFSMPGHKPVSCQVPTCGDEFIPVALIEAEPEVLGSLDQCIQRMPGFRCVQKDTLGRIFYSGRRPTASHRGWFSTNILDIATDTFQEQLRTRWPGVVSIPFGIFNHSDEIFVSMSGIDRGHFLRHIDASPNSRAVGVLAGHACGASTIATAPDVVFSETHKGRHVQRVADCKPYYPREAQILHYSV